MISAKASICSSMYWQMPAVNSSSRSTNSSSISSNIDYCSNKAMKASSEHSAVSGLGSSSAS